MKQIGTKTEQGKYALTELLICGECRKPCRCTWNIKGRKKIVWRCINRLYYGKKYCHNSPSLEENILHDVIMNAVMNTAMKNVELLNILKLHIGMCMDSDIVEDRSMEIQIHIAEIKTEFSALLRNISSDISADTFDDRQMTALMNEKHALEEQLNQYNLSKQKHVNTQSKLDEICTVIEGLQNHPLTYDDYLVRQLIECIVVESKERIKVIFKGGYEVAQDMQ